MLTYLYDEDQEIEVKFQVQKSYPITTPTSSLFPMSSWNPRSRYSANDWLSLDDVESLRELAAFNSRNLIFVPTEY